jgi:hypothetical protein
VQQHLPFDEPTSNNAIPQAHSLTAFLLAVVVGAQHFAHCKGLRADHILPTLLGLERFPSDDTIAEVDPARRPAAHWRRYD